MVISVEPLGHCGCRLRLRTASGGEVVVDPFRQVGTVRFRDILKASWKHSEQRRCIQHGVVERAPNCRNRVDSYLQRCANVAIDSVARRRGQQAAGRRVAPVVFQSSFELTITPYPRNAREGCVNCHDLVISSSVVISIGYEIAQPAGIRTCHHCKIGYQLVG